MTSKDPQLHLVQRIFAVRGADLVRYLRRRSRHNADPRDIAQEAFFRFLRLDDPERLANPEAYIFRIAANLLWESQLRSDHQEGQVSVEDPVVDATPYDCALTEQIVVRVRVALGSLPPVQRAVLILRVRDQMTFADIATHAGISQTMVRKHFAHGLASCRDQLKDLT